MIKKIDQTIDKISFYMIIIAVFAMLIFSIINIVSRWFNHSFLWIDPLVRHLVFLSAFLGGVLATGQDKHIRIDLAGKMLEKLNNPFLILLINRSLYLIAILATSLMAKAGYDFTKMEFEFGKEAFWGLHSGVMAAIIPFGMGLISLRFFMRFLLTFTQDKE